MGLARWNHYPSSHHVSSYPVIFSFVQFHRLLGEWRRGDEEKNCDATDDVLRDDTITASAGIIGLADTNPPIEIGFRIELADISLRADSRIFSSFHKSIV